MSPEPQNASTTTTTTGLSVVFLPDGRPAPAILTAEETADLLRLEGEHPERTLKFYRDEGQLTGVRLGRKVRYPLGEVLRFVAQKTAESKSSCLPGR